MSIVAKPLIKPQFVPNGSITTLYTCSVISTLIDKFTATNNGGSTETVDIYIVPSGGTAGASNKIISALSLTSGQVSPIDELQNHRMATGDTIQAEASAASSIVAYASGREAS